MSKEFTYEFAPAPAGFKWVKIEGRWILVEEKNYKV